MMTLPTRNLFASTSDPTLITDPMLLDAAGQLVGFWALKHLSGGCIDELGIQALAAWTGLADSAQFRGQWLLERAAVKKALRTVLTFGSEPLTVHTIRDGDQSAAVAIRREELTNE